MSNLDTGIIQQRGVLDKVQLADAALSTCRGLAEAMLSNQGLHKDLSQKFEPILSEMTEIVIAGLEPEAGAFVIEGGTVFLNEAEISRMMSFVIGDMKDAISGASANISPASVRETLNDIVSLFALHELRHCTQGIGKYSSVKLLKAIGCVDQMVKFDVEADRDAAVALAASRAGCIDSDAFFQKYEEALFYSVNYFFKIYPANGDRLDKTCRVASLLFMLARLQIYRALGRLTNAAPTDTVFVQLSRDKKAIAVYVTDPKDRLLGAANDDRDLHSLIDNIERGRLLEALSNAIRLTISHGFN